MRLTKLLIVFAIILCNGCATVSALVKVPRPVYSISSIPLGPTDKAAKDCKLLGSSVGSEFFYCTHMIMFMDMNLIHLRIISQYETLDIYDDNMDWRERPATKFLLDPNASLL